MKGRDAGAPVRILSQLPAGGGEARGRATGQFARGAARSARAGGTQRWYNRAPSGAESRHFRRANRAASRARGRVR
jgi:hypothetical protein